MDSYKIEKDIKVFCMQAETFPDGVMAAYDKLHALLPPGDRRRFYGISYGDPNGKIVYKAAAEELQQGEGSRLGCEEFVIKKGNYLSTVIKDYMKDLPEIGRVFQKMLQHPQLDPKGYCVENYFNDTEVQCMVRLQD
jgi:predicted transcriptional regulator YdeE